MAVLIVGADSLGNIEENLRKLGMKEISHVTGRNTADRKNCTISPAIKLVLILTDFVNHNTAKVYKKQAKVCGCQLVCAKRSWSAIEKKIGDMGVMVT